MQLLGWTAMGVTTTLVILALVNGWRGGKVLAWTPIRAIGRVSYGIYLWHVPVFVFVEIQGRSLSPLTRLLVAYAATAVIVVLSWFCIERPFLALKPRPRSPQARQPTDDLRPAAVAASPSPSQDAVGNGKADPGDHLVEHVRQAGGGHEAKDPLGLVD
jgi:peptidoglycan/LPS O-acetylase OafA/YrhL